MQHQNTHIMLFFINGIQYIKVYLLHTVEVLQTSNLHIILRNLYVHVYDYEFRECIIIVMNIF